MPSITTRENLENAPAVGTPNPDEATATRVVTLAKCLRCGFEWLPRVAVPSRCPGCASVLWNVPRVNKWPGQAVPKGGRKGKPRGKSFSSEYNPRHATDVVQPAEGSSDIAASKAPEDDARK